jgi:hypothetical protein
VNRKDKKLLAAIIILVLILALGYGAYLSKRGSGPGSIEATVSNIADRPNVAEDGFHLIYAKDSAGTKYTINATGYLNTPAQPDQFGEGCVNVPKLYVGDNIEFKLPKAETGDNTFDICYKKGSGDYFINVVS